jgi:acetone carboxylase gamma subunit
MAVALEETTPASILNNTKQMASSAHSCPECGTQLEFETAVEDAQRKIRELEAQVEMLKDKATAAGKPPYCVSHTHSWSARPLLLRRLWCNSC